MSYEYSTVSFPSTDREIGGQAQIASYLEQLVNGRASEGWEFYRVDQIGILVPPGCLAGLFGKSTEYVYTFVVIFRRPKQR